MISAEEWSAHLRDQVLREEHLVLRRALAFAPRLPSCLARELRQLGLSAPHRLPPGSCLGVVVPPGEARLVRISLSWSPSAPAPANLRGSARRAIHHAIELAAWHYPHPITVDPARALRIEVVDLAGEVPDIPVAGPSLGLSAFLAMWSLLAQQALLNDAVYTGQVELPRKGPPQILDVSHLADKGSEVRRAGLRFDTPTGDIAPVLEKLFGPSWDDPARWPVPVTFDAAQALRRLDLDYRQHALQADWRHAASRFRHLSTLLKHPNEIVLSLVRAGACAGRTHDQAACMADLREAITQADHNETVVEADVQVSARLTLAVALMRDYEFDEAEATCRRALAQAQTWQLVLLASHVRATLAQVLLATGRASGALTLLAEAEDTFDVRVSRTAYRVRALARLHRFDEAEEEAKQAEAVFTERGASPTDRAFLAHGRLDARLRRGRLRNDIDWAKLSREAEAAVQLTRGWPRPTLLRIAIAASVRCQTSPAEALARARDALEHLQSPRARWQLALAMLDVAVLEPSVELLDEAWHLIPSDGARAWFVESYERARNDLCAEHLVAWLHTERF